MIYSVSETLVYQGETFVFRLVSARLVLESQGPGCIEATENGPK